jgi:hypothetical protein
MRSVGACNPWDFFVRSCCAVLAVVALAAMLTQPALAERRVALVIGNAGYEVGPLRNPVNDAKAVAEVLADLGFS